mmetsp:Transcript_4283/g.6619  ORF Transcript_4283/g.6619 Transcript_4283/m.6619 type:complete len:307 (-) Transcript_4283:5111-6031(-)
MIADEETATTAAISSDGSPSQTTQPKPPTRTWCTPCRAIILSGATVIFFAAASSGVFSFNEENDFSSTFDPFDPTTWKLPDFMDTNPHGGNSPFDFNVWGQSRHCRGLKLKIINNLDEEWEPYFQQSIKDWEQGDPDVLSLSVTKAAVHDPDCEFVMGSMKVCNGDYGNTDWVGLNEVMLLDDQIIASVAFMNDYHLDRMSVEAKQNTMCHELGHGFGLGHWDENFWNRDMGNCMDYTNTYENNQLPDRSNFLFLERMYGKLDGTSFVNNTEALYCSSKVEYGSSTSSSRSEIFKKRVLTQEIIKD